MNQLLNSLPAADLSRITPHLRHVPLRSRQTVLRQGEPIQEIIFPTGGVCSLLKTMEDGHTIEIMAVGAEGAIGTGVAMGQADSATDVVVQIPHDAALALPVDVFRAEMQAQGALWSAIGEYSSQMTLQLMQASACNALHSADKRCCRWLLTADDRLQSERLPVTQEMLAVLLGIRRPTVTLIMAELQRAGIVDYARGSLAVRDRASLIARACECYRALSPGLRKVA
ncbi:MAG TPA: Crp/Fnr family transcriptional regulator [Vicinamibacterales bacterium]|nr:Crp/Fnr family transcriptional regulator [Vicinamibacterales bacterium]